VSAAGTSLLTVPRTVDTRPPRRYAPSPLLRGTVRQSLIALTLVLSSACAPQASRPVPDVATGLVGIPIEDETLLNGTWGVMFEFATILTLPVVGDRNAGSQQLWLHTRTWDEGQQRYNESFRWCWLDVWEVEGNKLVVPDSTIERHPAHTFTSTVNGLNGTWEASRILDLWGVRNLPDPETTALPTRHNWQTPPQSDWIFDEDEDGKPATSARAHGITEGDVFQVVRGLYGFKGTVINADRIQGLVNVRSYQQNAIKADRVIAEGESVIRQDADPLNTWFDMIRMTDGATCGDVKAAHADGRLARRRPF